SQRDFCFYYLAVRSGHSRSSPGCRQTSGRLGRVIPLGRFSPVGNSRRAQDEKPSRTEASRRPFGCAGIPDSLWGAWLPMWGRELVLCSGRRKTSFSRHERICEQAMRPVLHRRGRDRDAAAVAPLIIRGYPKASPWMLHVLFTFT